MFVELETTARRYRHQYQKTKTDIPRVMFHVISRHSSVTHAQRASVSKPLYLHLQARLASKASVFNINDF